MSVNHSASIRRLLVVLGAVLALSLAAASAASAEPKGLFKQYSDCPTEVSGVTICLFGQTTSGEFVIGTSKVPINKTITLQGGGIYTGGANLNEYFIAPAKDGNTLSKTELNVPGGLAGLINCEEIKGSGLLEGLARGACKTTFENGVTGVTASTELATSSTNRAILDLAALVEEKGAGVTLPIRVHLKNPLLGESCYIGSQAHPIILHLTDGTTAPPPPNGPIHGKLGNPKSEYENGYESVKITENSLVDNSFSAPASEGCGGLFSFLIGPIINAKIGLPSASGHNTAILNGEQNTAEGEAVLASESF